jgi:arsenite methyltransferase
MIDESTSQPMYENGSLCQVTGGPLRPGGFELTNRLISLCELPAHATMLDVGCGSGWTVHLLRGYGFNSIGVDRSEMLLKTGKDHHSDLSLACSIGNLLPIESGNVNAVLSECSLSAISSLEPLLAEFWRVLRSGGRLAVSDIYVRNPQGLPALRSLPLTSGLRTAAPQDEILARLKEHKFSLLVWEDHSEALKYIAAQMILSRGSMTDFWRDSEPSANPQEIQVAIKRAMLGYYLMIAEKK